MTGRFLRVQLAGFLGGADSIIREGNMVRLVGGVIDPIEAGLGIFPGVGEVVWMCQVVGFRLSILTLVKLPACFRSGGWCRKEISNKGTEAYKKGCLPAQKSGFYQLPEFRMCLYSPHVKSKWTLFLMAFLIAVAATGIGCGGVNASGSVSPATFLLPGLGQHDSAPQNSSDCAVAHEEPSFTVVLAE